MSSSSLFRVEVQSERERVRVVPHGELDLVTVPQLEAQIEQLRSRGFATVALDLRKLTFMDSTGLRLLLRLNAESRSNGFRFVVIDCEGPVRRLLRLTRVDGQFDYAEE
jgi:anti-sigma B factor antagonist